VKTQTWGRERENRNRHCFSKWRETPCPPPHPPPSLYFYVAEPIITTSEVLLSERYDWKRSHVRGWFLSAFATSMYNASCLISYRHQHGASLRTPLASSVCIIWLAQQFAPRYSISPWVPSKDKSLSWWDTNYQRRCLQWIRSSFDWCCMHRTAKRFRYWHVYFGIL
jgi:hypothetical protein